MRPLLILFGLLAAAIPLPAQITFERTIGGKENDNGMGIVVVPDGYITAGSTRSADNTNFDIYLVKTDLFGDTLWTRIYGGPYNESAEDIIHTGDGTYTLCGTAFDTSDMKPDLLLMRIADNGDSLWSRTGYSDLATFGNSVALTIDGYIACGYANQVSNTSAMAVVRVDDEGTLLWSKLYGEANGSVGTSITSTPDGGFIACGYIDTYTPGWNRNISLVRLSSDGDTLWTHQYAGPEYDAAFCVSMTFDGGYIITGYTFNLGAQNGDFILIKTDALGEVEWQKIYGSSGLDIGESGMQTSDGNYIFTGMTSEAGTELKQLYLVRTDGNGDTLWTRKYGEFPRNYGYDVMQTADQGFIATGMSDNTVGNSYDVYLVKTLPDGTITGSQETYDKSEVPIYPNPFSSSFIIDAGVPVRSVQVLDLSGASLLQEHFQVLSERPEISGTFLKPGLYLLKVQTDHHIFYQKVIKTL